VKTGSNGVLQWTSSELSDLEKALKINQKATATKPSLNLAAQILVPPLANSSTAPLPAPIPEPSTWLIFGLILGGAGLRKWAVQNGGSRRSHTMLPHGDGQASASAATAQPVAAAEMN
jgi:PEP-CTERM motif